jgi:hypothetical protein
MDLARPGRWIGGLLLACWFYLMGRLLFLAMVWPWTSPKAALMVTTFVIVKSIPFAFYAWWAFSGHRRARNYGWAIISAWMMLGHSRPDA